MPIRVRSTAASGPPPPPLAIERTAFLARGKVDVVAAAAASDMSCVTPCANLLAARGMWNGTLGSKLMPALQIARPGSSRPSIMLPVASSSNGGGVNQQWAVINKRSRGGQKSVLPSTVSASAIQICPRRNASWSVGKVLAPCAPRTRIVAATLLIASTNRTR